jgi:hypothetical protein
MYRLFKPIRKSLDVDSWAKAEEIKDEIDRGKDKQVTRVTVKEALAAWNQRLLGPQSCPEHDSEIWTGSRSAYRIR